MKRKFLLVLAAVPFIFMRSFVFATERQQELSIEPQVIEVAQEQMEQIAPELQTNPKQYYEDYMQIVIHYAEQIDPPETIYDYYSDDEISLIMKCVETEVHGADFMSKVNVANVIMNRIKSDKYPNDAYGVIVPGQFAFGRDVIDDETREAVEFAFMFPDTTDGALYFQSVAPWTSWNGRAYKFTDNAGHHFY